MNNLKRSQQNERKKSSQQLEESRQREENAQSDNEILKVSVDLSVNCGSLHFYYFFRIKYLTLVYWRWPVENLALLRFHDSQHLFTWCVCNLHFIYISA